MAKPLPYVLPADLPTNWTAGQTIAPVGTDVGLTEKHGYNYLCDMINRSQVALNTVNDYFEQVALGGVFEGLIGFWSGLLSDIPVGWQLCDGTNGTPNLLGLFIKGVATATTNPGNQGGVVGNTVTLGISHLPVHTHTVAAHQHTMVHTHTINHNHTLNHTHTAAHTHQIDHSHDYSGAQTGEAGLHTHNSSTRFNFLLVYPGTLATDTARNLTSGSAYWLPQAGSVNQFPWQEAVATQENGAHVHSITGSITQFTGSTGQYTGNVGQWTGNSDDYAGNTGTFSGNTAQATLATNPTGQGQAFSIEPAYFELAIIRKMPEA